MGHADIKTTMVYTHYAPAANEAELVDGVFESERCAGGADTYHSSSMTAKEQLRELVERLTEEEAAETLRLLDQRTDDLTRMLDDAPLDDESTTPEEDAAVQEALEAVARGDTISLEELRAELDAERR